MRDQGDEMKTLKGRGKKGASRSAAREGASDSRGEKSGDIEARWLAAYEIVIRSTKRSERF